MTIKEKSTFYNCLSKLETDILQKIENARDNMHAYEEQVQKMMSEEDAEAHPWRLEAAKETIEEYNLEMKVWNEILEKIQKF